MRWNIKFKHGLCADTVVEASDETEAKKAGTAFYRYNSTGTDFLKVDDVIEAACPVFDENWSGQTFCCDPVIKASLPAVNEAE